MRIFAAPYSDRIYTINRCLILRRTQLSIDSPRRTPGLSKPSVLLYWKAFHCGPLSIEVAGVEALKENIGEPLLVDSLRPAEMTVSRIETGEHKRSSFGKTPNGKRICRNIDLVQKLSHRRRILDIAADAVVTRCVVAAIVVVLIGNPRDPTGHSTVNRVLPNHPGS